MANAVSSDQERSDGIYPTDRTEEESAPQSLSLERIARKRGKDTECNEGSKKV